MIYREGDVPEDDGQYSPEHDASSSDEGEIS